MIFKPNTAGETEYKKFMFDTDFDELAERQERARAEQKEKKAAEAEDAESEAQDEPEPEPEAPTFSEEDLAKAREEGMAEGKQIGIDEAASAVEKQIGDTLNAIATQAQGLAEAQDTANQDMIRHAVSVAAALVKKLFPTLNQQTAQDQVQVMLENALTQVSGEQEIIVRVPETLAEDLHERIESVTSLSGFQGNVKILGDPGLNVGDCRLEWSTGGVARSAEQLAGQLDEIIDRNLGDMSAGTAENIEVSAEPAVAEQQPEEQPEEPAAEAAEAIEPSPAAEAEAEMPAEQADMTEQTAAAEDEVAEPPVAQPEAPAEEPMAVETSPDMPDAAPDVTQAEAVEEPAVEAAEPEPDAPVPSSQLFDEPVMPAPTDVEVPAEQEAAPDEHAPVPSSEAMHEAPPEPEPEETAEAEPVEEDDDSKYINPELLEILEARDAEEEAKD